MKNIIKKKSEELPAAPLASFAVVMHNTTELTADEKGQFCHALFQTARALEPAGWDELAIHARAGARFVVSVLPPKEDGEDE